MSDEAPEQESKTEDPSQKKLEEAHRKGDVAKSQEVTTWFMLLGSGLVFAALAPSTSAQLSEEFTALIANADQFRIGSGAFDGFFWGLAQAVLLSAMVPLFILAGFAIAANLVQHRPVLSVEPITPRWSKVSPIQGAKRLFSGEALVNFLKGLLKICIVSAIVVAVVWPERDRLDTMMTADAAVILSYFLDIGIKIFVATLAVITVIAGADFLYQRQKWWKKQMMTVQETREEYKQQEGDPQIKGRIRQLRQERARKRMMAAVPDATVVITNPTHFAVALKYDKSMRAPICVAKGVDAVALRIRALAEESDVPVIENPPLARALFRSVEIDQAIPTEHFEAVAQVIGFVMQLGRKSRWRAARPG